MMSAIRSASGPGSVAKKGRIRSDEISRLSELFLTGTTTDVMPIVKLDDKPVGKGKPGELTQKLQRVLAESLASGD